MGAFQFFASYMTLRSVRYRPVAGSTGGWKHPPAKKHSLTFPAREDTCRGDRGRNHRGENNYDGSVRSGLIFTSNRISRLFLSGPAAGGIEKMRSIFFQKTKSSPACAGVTKPAGSEAKATQQKRYVQYIKGLTE